MPLSNTYRLLFVIVFFSVMLMACSGKKNDTPLLFDALEEGRTGLHFNNRLEPTEDFNMFSYMYFYNGAGVGAGDFNNDGLVDLFFSSNQGENKLYINEGKLHFMDVTTASKIEQDSGWSTGVSVVDINNDGLLDIYVCKVGRFGKSKSTNQLLVCTGMRNAVPEYEDKAIEYGLGFSGFSTQASFFDYDNDGDLDMYLLNHAMHQDGSFAPRDNFMGTYDSLSGDRLFRNDNGHFSDVTKQSGINSSAIGYGLGVAVSDINLDGWPDIYVGNDFHENDYLYINQRNGTFAEEGTKRMMHTSKFSMGVDIADANNDGYPEIITMDMLPADPYILKRSLGDDDYDVFFNKISFGYSYQYSRNNLQYNRRNGMFSETGVYSGIYATDWSWAPLWADFDNDGLKDLFVSNGIPKRLNDMDYVNFIYNNEAQQQLQDKIVKGKDLSLIKKFPEIKIPNKFFKNNGNLSFQDMAASVKNDKPTYSNGAVYADFDNDGDLDIVVSNINGSVLLYENKSSQGTKNKFSSIKLSGPESNRNAVGAKIILFAKNEISTYEKYPARGFMSSIETPVYMGLGGTQIDSAFLIWPDNSFQQLDKRGLADIHSFSYKKGLPKYNYNNILGFKKHTTRPVVSIQQNSGLSFLHHENQFNEFDREPLMPHMVSTEGPALAVADINKDGLEDIFIGAAKTFHSTVFQQQPNGKFVKTIQPDMIADSMYEDVDATWVDVNNDGNIDLVVASGGNEYYGTDEHLLPRAYLNDGRGSLKKLPNAFSNIFVTASCILASDFNGDGFVDLFLGGRAVPWNYGETPKSYLLQNDGTGSFMDVTEKYAKELSNIGMVTNAVWCDADNDGDKDLVVSCEWGNIVAFINKNGTFSKKELTDKKGWWQFVLPVDVDNDGDMDFVCGNLGLNSRLQASEQEPVRMYFNDFDNNGSKEQVVTYYVGRKEIPLASKDELQKQIPVLKKKYFYAEDFARATIGGIFSEEKIKSAAVLQANYFSNAVLLNDGNWNFSTVALPWEAQLSTYRDAVVIDANGDGLPDILPVGNFYSNNIHTGRYDADFATVLINGGKGKFSCENLDGIILKGEARHCRKININQKTAYLIANNNDSLRVISFEK